MPPAPAAPRSPRKLVARSAHAKIRHRLAGPFAAHILKGQVGSHLLRASSYRPARVGFSPIPGTSDLRAFGTIKAAAQTEKRRRGRIARHRHMTCGAQLGAARSSTDLGAPFIVDLDSPPAHRSRVSIRSVWSRVSAHARSRTVSPGAFRPASKTADFHLRRGHRRDRSRTGTAVHRRPLSASAAAVPARRALPRSCRTQRAQAGSVIRPIGRDRAARRHR